MGMNSPGCLELTPLILLRPDSFTIRFDKELLNPDRNETLIVFRFRERLGGGGPPVKPLLEHWLATDIPVPPPPAATDGTGV